MNVTVSYPESMKANHEHVTANGRVMVHIGEGGDPGAVLVWVSPEVAAQWIEALTPIAAKAGQQ